MTTYQFTCPDCSRVFTVTEPMRDATIANGCPVCGASIDRTDFMSEPAPA